MGSDPASLADAVELFRKRFRPDAARDLTVSYQMELSGEGGGVLSVRVDRGRLEVSEGPTDTPDVVYRMSAADFFAILARTANPDLLYMAERIAIEGDLSLALKLRALFSNPA